MKHHCYLNSRSGRVLMSLGFRTCAALGLRLVKHEVEQDVTYLVSISQNEFYTIFQDV